MSIWSGDGGGRPWMTVTGGTIALLLGLAVLSWGGDAALDVRAYRNGVLCTGPGTRGCARDAAGLVESKESRRRKYSVSYAVRLRVDGRVHHVELDRSGTVARTIREGDVLDVRLWEGDVARLTVPGVGSVETDDSPLREWPMLVWALAPLGCAAWCLTLGIGMGRRHGWWHKAPELGPGGPWRIAPVAVMIAGAAAGAVSTFLDVYDPVPLLAVFGAVAALTYWRGARYTARYVQARPLPPPGTGDEAAATQKA